MSIWHLRPPIGTVFHGGDDGKVVSAPFALLHPRFPALKWARWLARKGLLTLYAHRLHTYIAELHACVRRSTFIVVCVPFVRVRVCVCGA